MIVRKRDELRQILQMLRNNGRRFILTNGVYDLLHYGHIKHLNNLKDMAINSSGWREPFIPPLVLIVAVNSDASVLECKGKLPVIEEIDRAIAVDELSSVDIVYIMGDKEPTQLIKDVIPNFYAKGPDRGEPEDWPEWDNLLSKTDIKCLVDKTKGSMRSSEIKQRIKQNV
jgi:D-beta-D-heptose 7-phosphate kinase/D-beta-D-heptose 1-phosphate adenosyltransferase